MGNTQSTATGTASWSAASGDGEEVGYEASALRPQADSENTPQPSVIARNTTTRSRQRIAYDGVRRRLSSLRQTGHLERSSPQRRSAAGAEVGDGYLMNGDEPTLVTTALTEHVSRSSSRMSRLGSRLLPETVVTNLLSSGEETGEEGEALRRGISRRRRPSVFERRAPSTTLEVTPLSDAVHDEVDAIARQPHAGQGAHDENSDAQQPYDEGSQADIRARQQQQQQQQQQSGVAHSSSRLSRVRTSLQRPLSGLFGSSRIRSNAHINQSPPISQSESGFRNDEATSLLSALPPSILRDSEETSHDAESAEPDVRSILSASRITAGMTSIRRFPHGLRSRSTRLVRRGEHPPLSQVLQLAAAAIAAQLSGNAVDGGGEGSRHMRRDALDGSIQNFVQTLQDAASAQAGEHLDLNAADGEFPPVNFMRVFQFPNDESGAPIAPSSDRNSSSLIDGNVDNGDNDRSVTLVLVGVRSMPSIQDGTTTEEGSLVPSLDALLSLPFLPSADVLRNSGSGALFRRTDTHARNNRARLPSTSLSTPLRIGQQHRQPGTAHRTSSIEPTITSSDRTVSSPIVDSPAGLYAPPSTPADIRSGHSNSLARRSSSASAVHPPVSPNTADNSRGGPQETSNVPTLAARQRRRSDSEFARRPELGSGAARRNGVVEPDRPSAGVGRSWLIYVVGTNVSPDHPAFTMPSLFTDNPSYEDMQLLSTLLGPVKPPVATQHAVNSAGGTFRLTQDGSGLAAVPSDGALRAAVTMTRNDRCLICLGEYEAAEVIRELAACQHIYHKDCIDEWLTTGRNSCPMCRGQGVQEPSTSRDAGTTT